MGVLDRLRALVLGSGEQSAPSAYSPFRCRNCGHEFDSTLADTRDVECPECCGASVEHA